MTCKDGRGGPAERSVLLFHTITWSRHSRRMEPTRGSAKSLANGVPEWADLGGGQSEERKMNIEQSKQVINEQQANTVMQGDCVNVMRQLRRAVSISC